MFKLLYKIILIKVVSLKAVQELVLVIQRVCENTRKIDNKESKATCKIRHPDISVRRVPLVPLVVL